jgi:hypothetical protein
MPRVYCCAGWPVEPSILCFAPAKSACCSASISSGVLREKGGEAESKVGHALHSLECEQGVRVLDPRRSMA